MAKQLGHVNYGGTIGGIRHFKIKGLSGNFAGLKGGATGDQIKNDPAFIRTRENMNEFAGCATVGKSLRTGLSSIIKQMSDPQLTGRLTGIIKKINLEDQSEARGYRAILVSAQPQYLIGLNFNRHNSFEGLFSGNISTHTTPEKDEVTLSVAPFSALSNVKAPAGATHFRLINAITVLSDFVFNPTTKVYEPLTPSLNEKSNITYSDYLELGQVIYEEMMIVSTLQGQSAQVEGANLISCVGIEFYQKVGENYYILSVGSSLKIKNIF